MEENKIRVILAVILTLLKIDRCFTLLTELQKSRKRLSIKVFKAKSAKGVNRLEPPFPACKTPIVGSIPSPASNFHPCNSKGLQGFSLFVLNRHYRGGYHYSLISRVLHAFAVNGCWHWPRNGALRFH